MENSKEKEKPSENNKNELKPIENITVLKEWEVFPKNKTEKNPYRQISFDMGDENYTLTYVDTSVENVGKRFEVSLYLTDSKEQAYFYYLNETPYEDDRLEEKEWLFINPEYLLEEMWYSLTCNEELKDFFLKKDYCELFPEQYGKPLPELPMDDKNIPDVELIVNNSFHYHKHNTAEDTLPQPIVFKNYKDVECDSHGKEEKRAEHIIKIFKEKNIPCLFEEIKFKNGNKEVKLSLEEDNTFQNPFLKFKTEGDQIKEIKYFENIQPVTKKTMKNVLNDFEELPELLILGKENGEYELGYKYIENLKKELINGTHNKGFITTEKMNDILMNAFEKVETPLSKTNPVKFEKVKDFVKRKIESQKTDYKGYANNLNLNFNISDSGITKYRTAEEYRREKQEQKNKNNFQKY